MQHTLNRRIMIGLLVIILTLPMSMINAQDTGDGCTVELEALVLALVQAQRAADTGNTYQAVQDLDAIQLELAELVEQCEGVLFPMPLNYTAPDDSVTFNYPADWVFRTVDTNIYLIASSGALMERMSENDELIEDDQAIALFVIPLDEWGTDPVNLDEFVVEFADEQLSGSARIHEPRPLDFLDQLALRLTYTNNSFGGYFDFIDYTDAEQPAILVVAGFGASSKLDTLPTLLKAFEINLQYPAQHSLRLTGVGLDALTYTTALSPTELNENIGRDAVLAPDGSALAWYSRSGAGEICVYTLENAQTACDPVPDQWRRQQPTRLLWSPNAAYIAWTSDFFRTFREADIMLYEVATRQLVNATDDGSDEWSLLGGNDELTGPVWLDAVINWGPDNYLYFVRDTLNGPSYDRDLMRTGLYRLDPSGGQPEQVRDMTGYFIENWAIFPAYEHNLEGVMALSPDASKIAFIVRYHQLDDPNSGIYIMDLSSTEPPVRVASMEQLQTGYLVTDEERPVMMPQSLIWTAEGDALIVFSLDPIGYVAPPITLLHHIDLATSNVTPLFNYTDLEVIDLMTPNEGEDYAPAFYTPRTVVLAPDGENLLALHFWGGQTGLSALTWVEGRIQLEQTLLFVSDEVRPFSARDSVSIAAHDGTLLLQGALFIPGE